jgi:hypothetical protein
MAWPGTSKLQIYQKEGDKAAEISETALKRKLLGLVRIMCSKYE